jgi:hypothetical protein
LSAVAVLRATAVDYIGVMRYSDESMSQLSSPPTPPTATARMFVMVTVTVTAMMFAQRDFVFPLSSYFCLLSVEICPQRCMVLILVLRLWLPKFPKTVLTYGVRNSTPS